MKNDYLTRIYRSDDPEDISSFSKVADANDIGFDTHNDYSMMRVSKDLLIGTTRVGNEARVIFMSEDQGDTWDYNEILDFYDTEEWESGEMPWPYGTFIRSSRDEGVFLSINVNDNSRDSDDAYRGGYPICGLMYSEDGKNWCNMEYYASNGRRGYTHNIENDGSIDLEGFRDHYAILDDGFDADSNGDYPVNYITHGTTTVNGNVALAIVRGRRVKNGSYSYEMDDLDICIYDKESYEWRHELIPITDIGSLASWNKMIIVPSGVQDKEVDFFLASENDAQWNWYRTVDGGKSYRKLDSITDYTDDPNRINSTPHFLDQQGFVIVTSDNATNCNLKFVMFDKRWR